MGRNSTLAARIREVLLNGRWIANTNYREQLQQVSWQQAIQQVEDLNTIAVLTYHVNYYLAGLLRALESGILDIRDKYSFDMPPIHSEADWNKLVAELLLNGEKFADQVEQMEDHRFDQPFLEVKYGTWLRNIEGVIEHCYYHLGQISLLRKLIVKDQVSH